jgi:hypothetical protein
MWVKKKRMSPQGWTEEEASGGEDLLWCLRDL